MNIFKNLFKAFTPTLTVKQPTVKTIGNVEFEIVEDPLSRLGDHYKLCELDNVYNNNILSAEQIVNSFQEKGSFLNCCIRTVLLAQTQSGKTSVAVVSANLLVDQLVTSGISPSKIDVWYCSNLPNNDLRKQNKTDFIKTNLTQRGCTFKAIHLHNYKKLIQAFKDLTLEERDSTLSGRMTDSSRVQILYIDEAHYSNHKDGLFEKLIEAFEGTFTTVYAVYISATPYSLLASNYLNQCDKYPVVVYQPGEGYNSLEDLYNAGKIKDTNDVIKCFNKRDEKEGVGTKGDFYLTNFGKNCIDEYITNFNNGNKGNFVVRLSGAKANVFKYLLEEYMVSKGLFPFRDYSFKDISPRINGTNDLPDVEVTPIKYRFFVIRGTARAGIRIENKSAVSMWIESKTKQNDSVAQAGCGRFTGYGAMTNCILYANLDSVRTVIKFNKQVFEDQQGSIHLQDWFPSSAHLKSDIVLKHQYKTSFQSFEQDTETELRGEFKLPKDVSNITENDIGTLVNFKQFYKIDKDRRIAAGILDPQKAKSQRLYVATSQNSKRTYNDLEAFSKAEFEVKDTYVVSDRTPASKGQKTELVLLDGISQTIDSKRYDNIMNNLYYNNILDTNGNSFDSTKKYVLTTEKYADLIVTSPVSDDELSDRMSEIV